MLITDHDAIMHVQNDDSELTSCTMHANHVQDCELPRLQTMRPDLQIVLLDAAVAGWRCASMHHVRSHELHDWERLQLGYPPRRCAEEGAADFWVFQVRAVVGGDCVVPMRPPAIVDNQQTK